MPKIIDYSGYIGKTFGKLTILEDLGFVQFGKQKFRVVLAKCACGKVKQFRSCRIYSGSVTCCGCVHGISKHKLYGTHSAMKARCYNPNCLAYKNYGARGISVCNEWLNSVEAFYNWSIYNGWNPCLELDRIDNDGNYEPGNCRWTTVEVQVNNRRTNKFIEFNGLRMTLSQWSKRLGLDRYTIGRRLRSGWSTEKTLTTPKKWKSNLP